MTVVSGREQAVIDRLRGALDAVNNAQPPWSEISHDLRRRSVRLRLKRLAVIVTAGAVVVAAVVGGLAMRDGSRSHRDVQTLQTQFPSPTSYSVAASTTIGAQGGTSDFATGNGAVFVADWTHGRILRLNPNTLKVNESRTIGSPQDSVLSLAYGHGSLWALDFSSVSLLRIDPSTMKVLGRTPVGGQPSQVAYGDGSVWMTAVGRSTNPQTRQLLERVNPVTGAVTGHTVIPGNGQSEQIAVGSRVAVSGETGPINIVDPSSMAIVRTMPVPEQHPAEMTTLGGQLYVVTDNEILHLATNDGTESVVFRANSASGLGDLNRAPSISGAAGLLWTLSAHHLIGIAPQAGRVVATCRLGGVSGVATVHRPPSHEIGLIATVTNGVDRLVASPAP